MFRPSLPPLPPSPPPSPPPLGSPPSPPSSPPQSGRSPSSSMVAYAPEPATEGWLKKRGRLNTAFKPRWMVLQGGTLSYFSGSAGKMELKGSISLIGGGVDPCKTGQWRINLTEAGVKPRVYVLEARNSEDFKMWLAALQRAVRRLSRSESTTYAPANEPPSSTTTPPRDVPAAETRASPPPLAETGAAASAAAERSASPASTTPPPAASATAQLPAASASAPAEPSLDEPQPTESPTAAKPFPATPPLARGLSATHRPALPKALSHVNVHGDQSPSHGDGVRSPTAMLARQQSSDAKVIVGVTAAAPNGDEGSTAPPLSPAPRGASMPPPATSPTLSASAGAIAPTAAATPPTGASGDERLVWLPVKDEDAWVVASIERVEGTSRIVATRKRCPRGIPNTVELSEEELEQLLPAYGALDEPVEDLTLLETISTASVLHTLR
jgi:hypothetical protein